MNKYGRLAHDHWEKFLPTRFAEIPAPSREEFFSTLGQQVQDQVSTLSEALERADSPNPEYLAEVGRLNMAKLMAEEKILAELVYLPPEIEDEEEDEPQQHQAHLEYHRDLQRIQDEYWEEEDAR
ncbi:TnpV protein [Nakamurella silvestris]|nr:TnpV protein [Nakamurella silvestris]